jgi:regulator of cell morphogenesis and NO signaling
MTTQTDWKTAPLGALLDHIIETHHLYLKRELPRLAAMLDQAPDIRRVFEPLREELENHLMKEEMMLFPLIRTLELAGERGTAAPLSHCGSVRNPIRVMEREHTHATAALAELSRLTAGYTSPAGALCDGLRALDADLRQHIRLEEDFLHPRAVAHASA